MKRLLFVALIAAFAGRAAAQTAAPEPKLVFASKINELEAGLSRNRPQLAAESYADLAAAMQQRIVALQSADPAQATKAQQVYNDAKQQSQNLQKNRQPLINSLRSFLAFY